MKKTIKKLTAVGLNTYFSNGPRSLWQLNMTAMAVQTDQRFSSKEVTKPDKFTVMVDSYSSYRN